VRRDELRQLGRVCDQRLKEGLRIAIESPRGDAGEHEVVHSAEQTQYGVP
jgi:hypothetical protein